MVGQVPVGVRADQAVLPPGLVQAPGLIVGGHRSEDACGCSPGRVNESMSGMGMCDELRARDGAELEGVAMKSVTFAASGV